jgi:hypothetical protein
MNRVTALNRRYAASASLLRTGVEIIAIGDPVGAQLDRAVRRLLLLAQRDGPGIWDDLVSACRLLRWRRLTQPQPLAFNAGLRDASAMALTEAARVREAVADRALLEEIESSANAVLGSESPVGDLLLRSIDEVGAHACVVVAMNHDAKLGMHGWLGARNVPVLTSPELERRDPSDDQVYAVGPPRFFASSLVTAPVADEVSFVIPTWFGDRSLPVSAISAYADGAVRVAARVSTEGDVCDSPPDQGQPATPAEDDFLPQPNWGPSVAPGREPRSHEVSARKVLLSGGLAIWLDDGERIRTLNLAQPPGERVTYTDVELIRPGSYLLLRSGETERGALYREAIRLLGRRRAEVELSQRDWKNRLEERLGRLGNSECVRLLQGAGVKTASRVRAWSEPSLVRPHSDRDFELLLDWLGIPRQPTFALALQLRRMLYQASSAIRDELETAVSAADLSAMEREGHMGLEMPAMGFRGIVGTRVLAVSPVEEIIARHDARIPFEEKAGRWLE